MKGNILIWPVAFLIIFLMTGCSLDKSSFYAKNGRLDLSHWDAKKDGIIKLDGEWELY